jgi:hypothetical protein
MIIADPSFEIDVTNSDPDRSSSPRIRLPPPMRRRQNHTTIPLATDFFNGLLGRGDDLRKGGLNEAATAA